MHLILAAMLSLMNGPARIGTEWSKPISRDPIFITSQFGMRSGHFHPGVDIAAPIGTIVRAVDDGWIVKVGADPIAGKFILIKHKSIVSIYCHLSKFLLVDGHVWRGRPIAESGNSGKSTGPHLHLSAMRFGKYIDPIDLINY
jgi:murein DD-endopeptidase